MAESSDPFTDYYPTIRLLMKVVPLLPVMLVPWMLHTLSRRADATYGPAGPIRQAPFARLAPDVLDAEAREIDEAAVETLRLAADQGDAFAMCQLGACYDVGEGVAADPAKSAWWYRQAAEMNFPEALWELGQCYAHGKGVGLDRFEAARWFQRAADARYAEAMVSLGDCYAHGAGLPVSPRDAYVWYSRAAEQGLAAGQASLGTCLYRGEGVARDEAAAIKNFRAAAEQGHAGAQYNLGVALHAALPAEALVWYGRAAEQGYAPAQYNLGACHFRGDGGVPARDLATARHYFQLAAAQHHPAAVAALSLLDKDATKSKK